jgi:hypothetical protein
MTTKPKTHRNLDGYGTPAIEWDRVEPTRVYAFGTAEPGGATRFDL